MCSVFFQLQMLETLQKLQIKLSDKFIYYYNHIPVFWFIKHMFKKINQIDIYAQFCHNHAS